MSDAGVAIIAGVGLIGWHVDGTVGAAVALLALGCAFAAAQLFYADK